MAVKMFFDHMKVAVNWLVAVQLLVAVHLLIFLQYFRHYYHCNLAVGLVLQPFLKVLVVLVVVLFFVKKTKILDFVWVCSLVEQHQHQHHHQLTFSYFQQYALYMDFLNFQTMTINQVRTNVKEKEQIKEEEIFC